jgi:DNA replication licensing factor MCM3
MATQLEVVGADQLFNQHVTTFTNFLDPANYAVDTETDYKEKIKKLIDSGERRLIVSVDDLRAYNRSYCDNLLKTPADYLPAFDKALKDIVLSLAPNQYVASELEQQEFHVGLDGSFGDHYVNPRSLSAKHLGKVVAIEGIVTKCGLSCD